MQKEYLSSRQAICILVAYAFGSFVIMGGSTTSGQDSWIALTAAAILVIPVFMIYARIMKLYPEKDIFMILEELFGKIIGKIFILLIVWYAIHLSALILDNFTRFVEIVAMPETPKLIMGILMILVSVYLVKSGIEIMGKWTVIIFGVILFIVPTVLILLLNIIDIKNLFPIMGHDIKTIFTDVISIIVFPFMECFMFLTVADSVKKSDSPYKIFWNGLRISFIVLLVIMLRNITALGSLASAEYFPSFVAFKIINVGDFLARIESLASLNFVIAGLSKVTICLFAASKGLARLFKIDNYKNLILPTSLLILAISSILYKNSMEAFGFLKYYKFYTLPFVFIMPIFIWIFAEIKKRKQIKNNQVQNQTL